MGDIGLEHQQKTPINRGGSERGAAKGAAFCRQTGPGIAPADDFTAALAMISALPLSPAEKAEAVRRLMAGQPEGMDR